MKYLILRLSNKDLFLLIYKVLVSIPLKLFKDIEIPVLTIFSKMAQFYKSGTKLKARAEAIRSHEIEFYPDMSHHLHMEDPAKVWKRIQEFITANS